MQINLPNILSLIRVPLLFVIALLLYLPGQGAHWSAFLLFLLGAFTDWLDGFLARRYNTISNFGKLIDPLTDKMLVIGLFISLLAFGILPGWSVFAVLLILVRELLITGLRVIAASRHMVLAAEKSGKRKTITQLASLGILLFAYALETGATSTFILSTCNILNYVGLGIFLLAAWFTVESGATYVKKYWDVFFSENYNE